MREHNAGHRAVVSIARLAEDVRRGDPALVLADVCERPDPRHIPDRPHAITRVHARVDDDAARPGLDNDATEADLLHPGLAAGRHEQALTRQLAAVVEVNDVTPLVAADARGPAAEVDLQWPACQRRGSSKLLTPAGVLRRDTGRAMSEGGREMTRGALGADDGPLEIASHEASWDDAYTAERQRLARLLPGVEICHIGSTAVPGLAAKPVIDMVALVDDLDATAHLLIQRAGYHLPAQFNKGLLHRRYLCYPSASHRTHHLHLVDAREDMDRYLRFRDLLSGDPRLANEYVSLKRSLAATFQGDRASYSAAKTKFINDALSEHTRPQATVDSDIDEACAAAERLAKERA
jgi:GrpB-like predicted nucleotidyltransferase (UPF0157 family)